MVSYWTADWRVRFTLSQLQKEEVSSVCLGHRDIVMRAELSYLAHGYFHSFNQVGHALLSIYFSLTFLHLVSHIF